MYIASVIAARSQTRTSMSDPPTLPPLPTSEALFSPKNSPNLDTIGSPQPRSIASTQNQHSAVDDIADIEAAYKEHGVSSASQRALEVYRRKEGRKGGFDSCRMPI